MDRLYRQEIEEEDRELQHEKSLDITPYYKPPKGGTEAPAHAAAARTGRTGRYVAFGSIALLAAAVVFLLLGRTPPAPPPVDEAAQRQMLTELAEAEVARQLAEKEVQLRAELDAERVKTAEVRAQLAKLQSSAAKEARSLDPQAQVRLDQAKELLAAREAEQRRKEAELAAAEQRRAETKGAASKGQAAPAAIPTVGVVRPTAIPTAVPAVPATVAPIGPALAREGSPPAAVPTAGAAGAVGLGGLVQEGDLVEFTRVDTPPEVLVEERPALSRTIAPIGQARGVVILSALVNEKGTVDDVRVLRRFPVSRYGVDEACVEAVKRYRFKPALKDGKRVKTWTTVTIPVDLTR
jgi:TonB family protein